MTAQQSLNMSFDEVVTTTRSVRKRLDFDKPVPKDVLLECLELAVQAPTGSNAQGWRWLLVDDPKKKKALADLYRKAAAGYLTSAGEQANKAGDEQQKRVFSSALYLMENLEKVPVHLIPC